MTGLDGDQVNPLLLSRGQSNAVANQQCHSWHCDDNAIVTYLPRYDKPTNQSTVECCSPNVPWIYLFSTSGGTKALLCLFILETSSRKTKTRPGGGSCRALLHRPSTWTRASRQESPLSAFCGVTRTSHNLFIQCCTSVLLTLCKDNAQTDKWGNKSGWRDACRGVLSMPTVSVLLNRNKR